MKKKIFITVLAVGLILSGALLLMSFSKGYKAPIEIRQIKQNADAKYTDILSASEYNQLKDDVEAYFNYNSEMTEQIIKDNVDDIKLTITFKRPLDNNEVWDFVNANSISDYSVEGRIFLSSDERITAFDNGEKGLDYFYNRLRTNALEMNGTVGGITAVLCRVDSGQLENIMNSEVVYPADVSSNSFLTDDEQNEANGYQGSLTWVKENPENPDYLKSGNR